MTPKISVIICTYNRYESLKRTLKSLEEMSVPKDLKWEILIVDNNSKDKTREVISDFIKTSGLNCKYLFEPKQGKSYALNHGINIAMGEILALTDDDVFVDKYWLRNIAKIFRENNVSCMGGKIFPIWEKPCPKWLNYNLWQNHYLYGPLALLDYGDNPFYLDEPYIWGANYAFKKEMFERYGIFDTSFGRTPWKLWGEETPFIRKLIENGEKVLYTPDIIVHHFIPPRRMRKSYFRKWLFDYGELSAIIMGTYPHRNILGIPLYKIKQTCTKFILWVLTLPLPRSRCFLKELELLTNISFILSRLRLKMRRKT